MKAIESAVNIPFGIMEERLHIAIRSLRYQTAERNVIFQISLFKGVWTKPAEKQNFI